MKNSKNPFGNAGQSTTEVKKPHKHDANLQKNSTLYFQIGLILCLLGTYSLFEMQFHDKKVVVDTADNPEVATIEVFDKFRIEPDFVPEKPKEKVRRTILTNKIVEVKNDVVIKKSIEILVSDPTPLGDGPAKVGDIPDIDTDVKDPVFVPFTRIEKVPVYPGCERKKTNDERKKCMSQKITKLIAKKFNVDVGSQYGISGKQRITTQFTIDKNGNVVDIKVRGPHNALEKEAKRVINKIPKMEPGKQRNEPVGVIYTLPIVYDARD